MNTIEDLNDDDYRMAYSMQYSEGGYDDLLQKNARLEDTILCLNERIANLDKAIIKLENQLAEADKVNEGLKRDLAVMFEGVK